MQEEDNPSNSKLESLKGFLRTFFQLSKEEWAELDHKLIRIVFGALGFAAVALFWLFFLRKIVPF